MVKWLCSAGLYCIVYSVYNVYNVLLYRIALYSIRHDLVSRVVGKLTCASTCFCHHPNRLGIIIIFVPVIIIIIVIIIVSAIGSLIETRCDAFVTG